MTLATALLVLAGCASPVDLENRSLPPGQANVVDSAIDWPAERPFVLMSFSGGGSRAAALALYVLQVLQKNDDGSGRQLIDDIDVISSVSGGSVTAAQFGLYGPAGLSRLEPDFLTRDNMAELELQAVNPITVGRLLFGRYTRVDALRDLLDRQLYHNQRFAALVKPGHPTIILNATDMASGEVFAFTPQRFNEICSDLSALPVSVGVAASAAFPVLLSPVNLQDFSYPHCPGTPPVQQWITQDLQQPTARYLNLDEYEEARYANALQHGTGASRDIRYLHLLDGGLADNLGLSSLMEVIASPHAPVPVIEALNEGKLRRVVVISVRARSVSPSDLYSDARTPGILPMVNSVISNPIDAATSSIAAQGDALLQQLRDAARSASQGASFRGISIYYINVDFDELLPEQDHLRREVENIPTSWTIKPADLENLRTAATLLVTQSPCFQRLLQDLGNVSVGIASVASDACPQPLAAPTSHRRSRENIRSRVD